MSCVKNSEGYLPRIPGIFGCNWWLSPGIPPGLHMHRIQVFRLVRAGSFDEVDDLVNLDGRNWWKRGSDKKSIL